MKALYKWCRGLEMSPGFTVWNCLERTNFFEGSLPWRFNTHFVGCFPWRVQGSWKSQFEQFSAVYEHSVLKWVNLHRGLERSSMHSDESLSGFCFGWSLPPCKVLGVMFPAIVLKVQVWVLCQCHGVWWRLVSDWCLFLSVGEESSEWGSTDDSLGDLDAGGEYDGDLGEYSCWGDGDEGDVWCVLVS